MRNPFLYGKVVEGDDFCQRHDAQKRLEDNIRRGQNTYIVGERRIGKTSLIEFVCNKIKNDFLEIFIDLRMLESMEDLEKRILVATVRAESTVSDFRKVLTLFTSYKPTLSLDAISGESTFGFRNIEKSSIEDIETLFDHIEALNSRKKVIVVFDEFQDISRLKNSKTILAKMRSKIQKHSLCYIFCGSIKDEIQQIFNDPSEAMYNSAEPIRLDSIDKVSFNSFLTLKFKEGRSSISSEVLDKIYEITENITGDTQQLCSALWEVSKRGEPILSDMIAPALDHIVTIRAEDFERVVDNLTALQMKILKALAKDKKAKIQSQNFMEEVGHRNFTAVSKAVAQLKKRNLIYLYRKEYKFYSPFLREWLKTKIS